MTVEIPLHSEKYGDMVALVDDEDAELVAGYTWNPHKRQHSKTFYAQAKIYVDDKRKTVYMHSLIAGANPGQQVDHRNRDGLDNRRDNLRFGTDSQHNANRGKMRNNTSGFIGVSRSRYGTWQARIKFDGGYESLGYYDDPVEAALVRDYCARQLHGEFAVLNFPHCF